MNDIKVMIVDDAPGMRMVLKKVIDRTDGFELINQCDSGEAAVACFDESRPQVVFMDVEMGGMTGIECANQLIDRDPSLIIIFATAHQEYMLDAFKMYAFDYLLKPFDIERLTETLNRVRTTLRHTPGSVPMVADGYKSELGLNKVMFKGKEGVNILAMSDIILIQREDRATVIYTRGGKFTVNDSLSDVFNRLDERLFLRCHKSYIINMSKVTAIYPYGRWTYVVKLKGIDQDALITHEKLDELEKVFS